MKKRRNRRFNIIVRSSIIILFIISAFTIVGTSFNVYSIVTYDISKNRSMQAVHLVSKYVLEETEVKTVTTFSDIITYASTNPVTFTGTMTGYGPDCEGCGRRVGCSPYQNVKNGNIYFTDNEYGKIRIIAGDKSIPCGTIIKVEKLRKYETFYAIVLDRGSAIKGTLFDLLFVSEKDATSLGRASATYTIVRWGW